MNDNLLKEIEDALQELAAREEKSKKSGKSRPPCGITLNISESPLLATTFSSFNLSIYRLIILGSATVGTLLILTLPQSYSVAGKIMCIIGLACCATALFGAHEYEKFLKIPVNASAK